MRFKAELSQRTRLLVACFLTKLCKGTKDDGPIEVLFLFEDVDKSPSAYIRLVRRNSLLHVVI